VVPLSVDLGGGKVKGGGDGVNNEELLLKRAGFVSGTVSSGVLKEARASLDTLEAAALAGGVGKKALVASGTVSVGRAHSLAGLFEGGSRFGDFGLAGLEGRFGANLLLKLGYRATSGLGEHIVTSVSTSAALLEVEVVTAIGVGGLPNVGTLATSRLLEQRVLGIDGVKNATDAAFEIAPDVVLGAAGILAVRALADGRGDGVLNGERKSFFGLVVVVVLAEDVSKVFGLDGHLLASGGGDDLLAVAGRTEVSVELELVVVNTTDSGSGNGAIVSVEGGGTRESREVSVHSSGELAVRDLAVRNHTIVALVVTLANFVGVGLAGGEPLATAAAAFITGVNESTVFGGLDLVAIAAEEGTLDRVTVGADTVDDGGVTEGGVLPAGATACGRPGGTAGLGDGAQVGGNGIKHDKGELNLFGAVASTVGHIVSDHVFTALRAVNASKIRVVAFV
jgi:hypothetical protein